MLDYYLDQGGRFPDPNYMKNEIGHKIALIYIRSAAIVTKRSIPMEFLQNLDDPIHQAILMVLSEFAQGDRYSNIDLLVGSRRQSDPIASWFKEVDQRLFETRVTRKKREKIIRNSTVVGSVLSPFTMVMHTSETGTEITDVEYASRLTGMFRAVAPYRQLYVLQIIRYWVELLLTLQYAAIETGSQDIPFFSEIFAPFYNKDSYIRTRMTWHGL